MIGARATKRRMVHGKSSEAEVGPAEERKTFLNRYKQRSQKVPKGPIAKYTYSSPITTTIAKRLSVYFNQYLKIH